MNRRSFIGSILALGIAPAIVRADSLMRIVPRDVSIISIDSAGSGWPAFVRAQLHAGQGWQEGDLITFSGLLCWPGDGTYRVKAVNGNVLTIT